MNLSMYIGNKIKHFRNLNKWTQTELGERIEVGKGTISHYENGIRTPDQDKLFELAEVFQISIDDLFPPREYKGIIFIYEQLEPPRQAKVYDFAEAQLETQNKVTSIVDTDFNEEYQGQAAAGVPIEGQQAIPFIGAETVSLLVNGDSMEDMFYDGDIIEYHPQPELENGEIGVFAVNGGITLKKFRKNDDIRLESLNKKYQDIVIKETDDFNILGKVII